MSRISGVLAKIAKATSIIFIAICIIVEMNDCEPMNESTIMDNRPISEVTMDTNYKHNDAINNNYQNDDIISAASYYEPVQEMPIEKDRPKSKPEAKPKSKPKANGTYSFYSFSINGDSAKTEVKVQGPGVSYNYQVDSKGPTHQKEIKQSSHEVKSKDQPQLKFVGATPPSSIELTSNQIYTAVNENTYSASANSKSYITPASSQPYNAPAISKATPAKSQTYTIHALSQAYTTPIKSQTSTAPATSQVYTAPAVSQSYTTPAKSQVYTTNDKSQTYTAPATNQVYTAPTISQSYTTPEKSQVYTTPGKSQTYAYQIYTAPTISQSYTTPAISQVYTAPPISQSYTTPLKSQVYTAPASSKVYAAPAISQVYTAPPISQSYTTPLKSQVYTTPSKSETYTTHGSNQVYTAPAISQVNNTPAKSQVYTTPEISHVNTKPEITQAYITPAKSQDNTPGKIQTYIAPATRQAYTAPALNQVNTPPATSQAYTMPGHSQLYTAPATSQVNTTPADNQVYTAPASRQTYTTPSKSQVYTIPSQSQTYTATATNQVYTAPVIRQVNTPAISQVYTTPEIRQVNTIPVINQAYTMPAKSQVYNAPGKLQTNIAPATSQVTPTKSQAYTMFAISQSYKSPIISQAYSSPTTNQVYSAPLSSQSYSAPAINKSKTVLEISQPVKIQTYTASASRQTYSVPEISEPYPLPVSNQYYTPVNNKSYSTPLSSQTSAASASIQSYTAPASGQANLSPAVSLVEPPLSQTYSLPLVSQSTPDRSQAYTTPVSIQSYVTSMPPAESSRAKVKNSTQSYTTAPMQSYPKANLENNVQDYSKPPTGSYFVTQTHVVPGSSSKYASVPLLYLAQNQPMRRVSPSSSDNNAGYASSSDLTNAPSVPMHTNYYFNSAIPVTQNKVQSPPPSIPSYGSYGQKLPAAPEPPAPVTQASVTVAPVTIATEAPPNYAKPANVTYHYSFVASSNPTTVSSQVPSIEKPHVSPSIDIQPQKEEISNFQRAWSAITADQNSVSNKAPTDVLPSSPNAEQQNYNNIGSNQQTFNTNNFVNEPQNNYAQINPYQPISNPPINSNHNSMDQVYNSEYENDDLRGNFMPPQQPEYDVGHYGDGNFNHYNHYNQDWRGQGMNEYNHYFDNRGYSMHNPNLPYSSIMASGYDIISPSYSHNYEQRLNFENQVRGSRSLNASHFSSPSVDNQNYSAAPAPLVSKGSPIVTSPVTPSYISYPYLGPPGHNMFSPPPAPIRSMYNAYSLPLIRYQRQQPNYYHQQAPNFRSSGVSIANGTTSTVDKIQVSGMINKFLNGLNPTVGGVRTGSPTNPIDLGTVTSYQELLLKLAPFTSTSTLSATTTKSYLPNGNSVGQYVMAPRYFPRTYSVLPAPEYMPKATSTTPYSSYLPVVLDHVKRRFHQLSSLDAQAKSAATANNVPTSFLTSTANAESDLEQSTKDNTGKRNFSFNNGHAPNYDSQSESRYPTVNDEIANVTIQYGARKIVNASNSVDQKENRKSNRTVSRKKTKKNSRSSSQDKHQPKPAEKTLPSQVAEYPQMSPSYSNYHYSPADNINSASVNLPTRLPQIQHGAQFYLLSRTTNNPQNTFSNQNQNVAQNILVPNQNGVQSTFLSPNQNSAEIGVIATDPRRMQQVIAQPSVKLQNKMDSELDHDNFDDYLLQAQSSIKSAYEPTFGFRTEQGSNSSTVIEIPKEENATNTTKSKSKRSIVEDRVDSESNTSPFTDVQKSSVVELIEEEEEIPIVSLTESSDTIAKVVHKFPPFKSAGVSSPFQNPLQVSALADVTRSDDDEAEYVRIQRSDKSITRYANSNRQVMAPFVNEPELMEVHGKEKGYIITRHYDPEYLQSKQRYHDLGDSEDYAIQSFLNWESFRSEPGSYRHRRNFYVVPRY